MQIKTDAILENLSVDEVTGHLSNNAKQFPFLLKEEYGVIYFEFGKSWAEISLSDSGEITFAFYRKEPYSREVTALKEFAFKGEEINYEVEITRKEKDDGKS